MVVVVAVEAVGDDGPKQGSDGTDEDGSDDGLGGPSHEDRNAGALGLPGLRQVVDVEVEGEGPGDDDDKGDADDATSYGEEAVSVAYCCCCYRRDDDKEP